MCGIAGFVADDPSAPVAQDLLKRMVGRLRDRGPDGEGYHAEPGVGLGHARLSIIDIETGAQPLANEDRSVWVSFNGEIFNYVELRRLLEERGHQFSTRSDTEVIVHLYEEYGDEFAHQLNGQFAIALWDRKRRRLLLVRDRPGILPLYFARGKNGYLFSSEIKSLLPDLPSRPEVNSKALQEVFTFWGPLGPDSLFAGVASVRPGEMVSIERGRVRRWQWWDWTFPTDGNFLGARNLGPSVDELAETLRELLLDATRLRLRADVPVGAYLSGGLDSSAVAALALEAGKEDLRTFSVTFDDPGMDERVFQAQVQRHLQTQ
ncbi:MAG: asparagine synthase (glutamine-hydrolyzing), partial [Pseudomonadales bacterium]